MIDRPSGNQDEFTRAVEAADRAGAIVTEHVRSIIDAAQTRADEVERSAREEADEIRSQAEKSARRVLERIDAVEGHLGTLVGSLRQDADSLTGEIDRRS